MNLLLLLLFAIIIFISYELTHPVAKIVTNFHINERLGRTNIEFSLHRVLPQLLNFAR